MTGEQARLILNGTLPNGEGWQAQLLMLNVSPTVQDMSYWVAHADLWMNGFLAAGSGMLANYTPSTTFNPAKVQALTGSPLRVTEQGIGTSSGVGTDVSAANPLPAQLSVCVTERALAGGPPARGRFYLPPPKVSVLTATGRLTAAATTAYAAALENAYTIYSGGDATLRLGIVNQAGTQVTVCRRFDVGDVLDTMRSRRNKQTENRVPVHVGYTI